MYASLTVVTYPALRALSALRQAWRLALAAGERPNIVFARAMQTRTFRSDMRLPLVPLVVLIHGVLRVRYFLDFARDSAKLGRQLTSVNGYLGGLALSDTPLTTAWFSCWRTVRDSRAFAFGSGAHQHAYKIDRKEHRHEPNSSCASGPSLPRERSRAETLSLRCSGQVSAQRVLGLRERPAMMTRTSTVRRS